MPATADPGTCRADAYASVSATRSAGLAVRVCTPAAEAGAGAGAGDRAGDRAAAAAAAPSTPTRPNAVTDAAAARTVAARVHRSGRRRGLVLFACGRGQPLQA
jgi:hypothetical protein